MGEIRSHFSTWIETISGLGPQLLKLVLILAIGLVTAFLMKRLAYFLVKRIHRRESSLLGRFINTQQLGWFAHSLSQLTFWVTVFVFVVSGGDMFGVDMVHEWTRLLTRYVPSIFASVVILVIGVIFSGLLRDFVRRSTHAAGFAQPGAISLLIYGSGCVVSALVASKQLGIDVEFITSTLLVILTCLLLAGALSFGIGSAPIVTDILSIYYLSKSLQVGQDLGFQQTRGRILTIGATSVTIETPDGKQVIPARELARSGYQVSHGRD